MAQVCPAHRRGQLRVPVGLEVTVQAADHPHAPPDQSSRRARHCRLKDWQILRQCRRRRGDAINHSPHIIAGLWNLKTRKQLRVKS
jgi:hypothetical protein